MKENTYIFNQHFSKMLSLEELLIATSVYKTAIEKTNFIIPQHDTLTLFFGPKEKK